MPKSDRLSERITWIDLSLWSEIERRDG